MTNITILGAGLVGSAIVKDLAQDEAYTLTVADVSSEALVALAPLDVKTHQADLRDKARIHSLVADADLVISAVPGWMGYATLKAIIEAKKDIVDISFFPEDALDLDELAKAQNVTAVVDCGVAPGLCNIMAGYVDTQLDVLESYLCYVGGLPTVRRWPYEYNAVFSPSDVIEEYTRPARFVEYGQPVIRPALSDPELIDFPGVGTLEAFNTDGLRTLAHTLDAPFMKEKTLRYPGHIDLMRAFRESGFFGTEAIMVDGQAVIPLHVTSKLLFEQWQRPEGEADVTVMQVIIAGKKDGEKRTYTYDLLDYYSPQTRITSMARTTGYTCTIIARQVLKELFTQKGICPPEFVGRTAGCWEDLLKGYTERNITVQEIIS